MFPCQSLLGSHCSDNPIHNTIHRCADPSPPLPKKTPLVAPFTTVKVTTGPIHNNATPTTTTGGQPQTHTQGPLNFLLHTKTFPSLTTYHNPNSKCSTTHDSVHTSYGSFSWVIYGTYPQIYLTGHNTIIRDHSNLSTFRTETCRYLGGAVCSRGHPHNLPSLS